LCACLPSLSFRHSRGREARWVRTKEIIRSRNSVSTNERNDSFAKLAAYERNKLFVRRWNEGARERNY
jgi:hypothetical protein